MLAGSTPVTVTSSPEASAWSRRTLDAASTPGAVAAASPAAAGNGSKPFSDVIT
jgi:hypothetical protein